MSAVVPVFDEIPQFGIFETEAPSFTPPEGVLMWDNGTNFVVKLDAAQKAMLGGDLAARVTYHAQCDNYDRLGGVFFLSKPIAELPVESEPRIEMARFITPFSNFRRGELATYVFPDADISVFARALADSNRDVWVGIGGGSNPYDGDPCTTAVVTPEWRSVGFKYSLDFVSTSPAPSDAKPALVLTASANTSETLLPIVRQFENLDAEVHGYVSVIVSGHGADEGGGEYRNTRDRVSLNGAELGSFDTGIDCAPYAAFSPDGNAGIFRGNLGANPRNWCPGALVPAHRFPATLAAGTNDVTLEVSPADVPSGSYYATSFTFVSR